MYKTLVIFKSVTFDFFFENHGKCWDDANSIFHEDQKIFKSDTSFVTFKSVTFEIFGKSLESANFDANDNLQEDLKLFKSDTFENYKSFVPVEVQSQCLKSTFFEIFSSSGLFWDPPLEKFQKTLIFAFEVIVQPPKTHFLTFSKVGTKNKHFLLFQKGEKFHLAPKKF